MDYLESIETQQLVRKKLSKTYLADDQLAFIIKRNKRSFIRRNLWNLIHWFATHRPQGVLADMLFAAYRMGLEDATFEPDNA